MDTRQYGSISNRDFLNIIHAAIHGQQIEINGKQYDGNRTQLDIKALYQQIDQPDGRSNAILGYDLVPVSGVTAQQRIERITQLAAGEALQPYDLLVANAGIAMQEALAAGKKEIAALAHACLSTGASMHGISVADRNTGCMIPGLTPGMPNLDASFKDNGASR